MISSIPRNRISKDENDIEALILTQDKNLRCIAVLASKIMIAYPQEIPLSIQKKIVTVLLLGRFNWVTREILAGSPKEFPFAPKSLFELFSIATSFCQCYMNMWNILPSNLTTLMDNLIKLKQWLDKLNKDNH